MSRILVVLGFVVAISMAARPASANVSSFTGAWEAIDQDGSHMTFTVSGGSSSVRVLLFDDYATSCVNRGARGGAATIQGSGTVSGSTLVFVFGVIRCQNGIVIGPGGGAFTFTYDPDTDTMVTNPETWGVITVWHRIGCCVAQRLGSRNI